MYNWQTIKIVVVGDGAVGKTSLVMTYTNDTFPGEYIPYVADVCMKNRLVDGTPISLELWDTPAQDGYDRLRPTCYPQKWYPEVSEHAPNTPIILVGTKLDLRNDEKALEFLKSRNQRPITTEQALETKERIGACNYIECSSLTRENLTHLFDEVLRIAAKPKKKKCLIM